MMRTKRAFKAVLVAGSIVVAILSPFLWMIFHDFIIKQWILDYRSRPSALEDRSRNWHYHHSWQVKSHPFWVSEDQIAYVERRIFEQHREGWQWTPDDYPAKSEFWLIKEDVAGQNKSETFLLAQAGGWTFGSGYTEEARERFPIVNRVERDGNEMK